MAKKRGIMSRKQQRWWFASKLGEGKRRSKEERQESRKADAIEETKRRQEGLPPRKSSPALNQVIANLSSGRSSDPHIQNIQNTLKKKYSSSGQSFNPGQSGKSQEFYKLFDKPVVGEKSKRLIRGKMVEVPQTITIESGAMEPEWVNKWTPSGEMKGKLWERAERFVRRSDNRSIATTMGRAADKRLKKLDKVYSPKDHKEALSIDKDPEYSGAVRTYGKHGYHLVPRLELTGIRTQKDSKKESVFGHRYGRLASSYDREQVVYPVESKRFYERESELLFPGYKKRIVTDSPGLHNIDPGIAPSFTGEYTAKHTVKRMMSELPASVKRPKMLNAPFGPQPMLRAFEDQSSKSVRKISQLLKTGEDTNKYSPFRSVSQGRTRNFNDEVIELRKAGRAFIIDEQSGQPILSPKMLGHSRRIEIVPDSRSKRLAVLPVHESQGPATHKDSKEWSNWKPDNLFDQSRWSGFDNKSKVAQSLLKERFDKGSISEKEYYDQLKDVEKEMDADRKQFYDASIRQRDMNPRRRDLEEAEYQTWLKIRKEEPVTREERLIHAAKTVMQQKPVTMQQKILQHRVKQAAGDIRQRRKEKSKSEEKFNQVVSKARERERSQSTFQRIKKRIKRILL